MTRKLVVFRKKKSGIYGAPLGNRYIYGSIFFGFLKLESEIRKDIKDKRK